jgi:uncharacterized protein (DUF58 family)
MPYTYKSLALAWSIIFALFAASASGLAQGGWFVVLLALAIVAPALVLRSPVRVAASPERPLNIAEERQRPPLNSDGLSVRSSTRNKPA